MKISQDEIEDLYAFTRLHFVEHYDLQTELVDHMANDIESVWIKQPKLPYTEARDKAFKKFGIFGFMDVVSKRQKAMGKRYHKYLWEELKEWFTVPKLVITLSIWLGFYAVLSSTFATNAIIGSFSIIALMGVLSLCATLITLWMYISFELLPNKAEDLLNETYSEFSL
jgi:hypothetical protein